MRPSTLLGVAYSLGCQSLLSLMIVSKELVSLGLPLMSLAKLSLQSELQKPTMWPLSVVSESCAIGFPERGQNLLIACAIGIPSLFIIHHRSGC
jgi:hypothetical protein